MVAGVVAGGCGEDGQADRHHGAEARARGWEKLPVPAEVRDRLALVATDDEVLAFGGCAPKPRDECDPTRDAFAFDPSSNEWREIPPAPIALIGTGAWTGDEAIFLGTGKAGDLRGLAYEPHSERWRRLPPAPAGAKGDELVWTGSELVVWGGGKRRGPGAAYDPAANTWRKLADAPLSLNSVSLVWTGAEVIAFGSRLDRRNRSSSRTAVAIAYEPHSDTWRRLPDSGLSPQADTAQWVGRRMIAYDYLTRAQSYDPGRNRWSAKRRMPLEPGECYPDSTTVGRSMLAFYCGQVALFDPGADRWSMVSGGLTKRVNRSNGYRSPIRVWRFARLAAIGNTAYFLAEGITFSRSGEAQYGFRALPGFVLVLQSVGGAVASPRALLLCAARGSTGHALRPELNDG